MILGITGNIASGKSTVSSIFKDLGFKLYDADKIAKEILNKKETIKKITEKFPKEIIGNDGYVNKIKMKELIFKSDEYRNLLNSIIHPLVFEFYKNIKNENIKNENIIFDIPLLYETNMQTLCDKVVLVVSDYNLKIERISKRDNISKNLAKKIIESQMDDEAKMRKADYVIFNNGSYEKLKEKTLEIYMEISKWK